MIKTKKKGILTVISGPSGCGKDTVTQELLRKRKNIWLSVSCTSRLPRPNEENGKDYYFLTREEFKQKIDNGEMLEYAEYSDNYYGTPKEYIKSHLDNGEDVILVIEIQGAMQLKELLPETLFIFILPPSMDELKRRLENRNTETKDKIDKRFKRAYAEINEVSKYNYVVVNDEIEIAANKIDAILTAEKCRVDRIEEVYLNNEEEKTHESLIDKSFDNSEAIL